MPEVVHIRVETPDQAEIRALLAASDAYFAGLYPAESNHLLGLAMLQRPEVTFLVARLEGRAVGCGALLRRQGYGEIKRMFIDPAARRRQLGRRVLGLLEALTAQQGLDVVRLEAGTRQPEALTLYRSAGYAEILPFGDYTPDPLSVFMEKRLVAAGD